MPEVLRSNIKNGNSFKSQFNAKLSGSMLAMKPQCMWEATKASGVLAIVIKVVETTAGYEESRLLPSAETTRKSCKESSTELS